MNYSNPDICTYSEVAPYTRKNRYIRHGYRVNFSTLNCIKSIIMLSNETVDIWICLFGGLSFIYQVKVVNEQVLPWYKYSTSIDYILITFQCLCFATSCFLSAAFHIFCCHSEIYNEMVVNLKSIGGTIAIWGSYVTSFYYAFDCFTSWRWFYIVFFSTFLVGHHFIMLISVEDKRTDYTTMLMTISPVLLGIVPSIHWIYISGGFKYQAVYIIAPKILSEYIGGGIAVLICLNKVPEKYLPGRLDYFCTSYQLCNVLTIYLMVLWHNTCLYLIDFSLSGTLPCPYSDDLYSRNHQKQIGSGNNLFFDNSGTE